MNAEDLLPSDQATSMFGPAVSHSAKDFADERLRFQIPVPESWPMRAHADSVRAVARNVDLVSWNAPDKTAGLEIKVCRIPRDINPVDWYAISIQRQDHKLLTYRTVPTASGELSDGVTREEDWLWRTVTLKNGQFIFMVRAGSIEKEYVSRAGSLLNPLLGFEFLKPSDQNSVEPEQEVNLRDEPVPLSLKIFDRWKHESATVGDQSTHSFRDGDDEIRIEQFPSNAATTHQQLIRKFTDRLNQLGASYQGAPIAELPEIPRFRSGAIARFPGKLNDQKVDAIVTTMKHDSCWISLQCIGASTEEDPIRWAITKRAYEVVRGSVAVATF